MKEKQISEAVYKHHPLTTITFFVVLPHVVLIGLFFVLFPVIEFSVELLLFLGLYLLLIYWNTKLFVTRFTICKITDKGFNYTYLEGILTPEFHFVSWSDVLRVEATKGMKAPHTEIHITSGKCLPKPAFGWLTKRSGNKLILPSPISFKRYSWTEKFDSKLTQFRESLI